MPAIVSSRDTEQASVVSEYFEFGWDASVRVIALVNAGGGAQHVTYNWHSTCYDNEMQRLLDNVIADEKPTWSEMVDHWVWYIVQGWAFDTNPRAYCTAEERYASIHEMLGKRSKAQVKLGEQLLHAMQDMGLEVPQ